MDLHYAMGHGTRAVTIHLVRVYDGWSSGLIGTSVCGARMLAVTSSKRGDIELRVGQIMCKKCVKYTAQSDEQHQRLGDLVPTPKPEHGLSHVNHVGSWKTNDYVVHCICGWTSEPASMPPSRRGPSVNIINAHIADLKRIEAYVVADLEQEQLARDIGEAIYWACRQYGTPTRPLGDNDLASQARGQFILTTLTAKGYYLKREGS